MSRRVRAGVCLLMSGGGATAEPPSTAMLFGMVDNLLFIRGWILTLSLVLASIAVSFADEILPIGKILANAPSLADHLVTFRGLVVSLEKLPPLGYRRFFSANCFMQNRYIAVI